MKVEVEQANPNIVIIDGKKYIIDRERFKKIDKVKHLDRVILKEVNEEELKENIKTIVDAIKKHTNIEEVLSELLKDLDYYSIRRIVKRIKAKKPIKKQKACLAFKIGDAHIQLIG